MPNELPRGHRKSMRISLKLAVGQLKPEARLISGPRCGHVSCGNSDRLKLEVERPQGTLRAA